MFSKKYTYNLVLAHSSTGSKSKYSGGFQVKNGRKNNTSAYNHDYYIKNKEKWRSRKAKSAHVDPNMSDEEFKSFMDNDMLSDVGNEVYGEWDEHKMRWVDDKLGEDPHFVALREKLLGYEDEWENADYKIWDNDYYKDYNSASSSSKASTFKKKYLNTVNECFDYIDKYSDLYDTTNSNMSTTRNPVRPSKRRTYR